MGTFLQINYWEDSPHPAHCGAHHHPTSLQREGRALGEMPSLSSQSVCVLRAALASAHQCHPLPRTLSVLKSTPQVRGMHTIIR